MKYFVDATIVEKRLEVPTQKINYEVNTVDTTVTFESIKAEITTKIKVPEKYRLVNEKMSLGGKERDLSFNVSEGRIVFYTANFELIPVTEKAK